MEYFGYGILALAFLLCWSSNGVFGTAVLMAIGYGIGFYFWDTHMAGVLWTIILVFAGALSGGESSNFSVRKTNWSPELKKKNGFIEEFDIDIRKK